MSRTLGRRAGTWVAGASLALGVGIVSSRLGAGVWAWLGAGAAGGGLWALFATFRRTSEVDSEGNAVGSAEGSVLVPSSAPRDNRPADGEVGIVPVLGVIAGEGPLAPEFRPFEALGPLAEEPPARGFRVWGRRFPPLLGRVAIVSVFVGRDGQPWSDDELVGAHRALKRAGAWIEREAIRWQVPVNVDLADTYFSSVEEDADREVAIFRPDDWGGMGLPDPDAEARILGILGRTAAALGFADPVDLIGRIGRRIEADQIVWLLHVRRAGKSIALPSDATGIPGVAVAVCYAQEEDFEAPMSGPPFADPITFVHELMHLFGANDKYDQPRSHVPHGTVSERDIMVLGVEALSRLAVEPLTAVEIGWASSPTERPTGPVRPLRSAADGGIRGTSPAGKKKRPRRPR
ncbi:hypothetical protein [Tautonia sociabilis]|uniref:hypothetical protein n=1 Tax=Tautonia sociabilis TaxID=2080755 RepID=UPI0013151D78|nr:hypothetical protein [Tautonia sociabilis]